MTEGAAQRFEHRHHFSGIATSSSFLSSAHTTRRAGSILRQEQQDSMTETRGSAVQQTRRLPTPRAFVRSNFTSSFLYPLKGVYYLATRRFLWPLIRGRILPLTVLSTGILAVLFLTIYLPIVAFLALFHYRGSAWVNGTFLVLEIGSLIVALVFEALFVDHTQVDIFDAVLIAEGHEGLVKNRRDVADERDEQDPVRRLGARDKGATFAPFSIRQIVELVLAFPLNFVPFVGVPLFVLATGYRAGPLVNWRYFQLKEFTKKQRQEFVKSKKRKYEYLWFGTVYMALQLIPILSIVFLLTSAVGSALWSIQIENETARSVLGEGGDGEVYRDEP